MILASRISAERTGVTKRDSSVPLSHSRATTSEVRKAPTRVMIRAISPGTRYQVLLLAALNHIRSTIRTPPCTRSPPRRSTRCSCQTRSAPFT